MENTQEAKEQYDSFKESGILIDLFPDFTGDWSIDKKDFLRYYRENQLDLSLENLIEVNEFGEEVFNLFD